MAKQKNGESSYVIAKNLQNCHMQDFERQKMSYT